MTTRNELTLRDCWVTMRDVQKNGPNSLLWLRITIIIFCDLIHNFQFYIFPFVLSVPFCVLWWIEHRFRINKSPQSIPNRFWCRVPKNRTSIHTPLVPSSYASSRHLIANLSCIFSPSDAVLHARPVLPVPAGIQPAGRHRPLHEEAGRRGEHRAPTVGKWKLWMQRPKWVSLKTCQYPARYLLLYILRYLPRTKCFVTQTCYFLALQNKSTSCQRCP